MSTVTRLKTRLRNHSVLIRVLELSGREKLSVVVGNEV